MYIDKTLESVFVEIISKVQKNTITGCIYKHPKLAISDFTNAFPANKNIILGDFNIDLLQHESHTQKDFFDCMYSRFLSPQITIPTRITPPSSTQTWLMNHY